MKQSKKSQNLQALAQWHPYWHCPICEQPLQLDETTFTCEAGHQFDCTKQGTINLSNLHHTTKYDRHLFHSRQKVMSSSFFEPVLQMLAQVLRAQPVQTVLDAGCGEGTHVERLAREVGFQLVGLDLAKEGILTAAQNYPGHAWVVGDLANIPFATASFDVVLNILSPANYREFDRVLANEGRLIKIVPGPHYLQELREKCELPIQPNDTNPFEKMHEYFDQVTVQQICTTIELTPELYHHLLIMTPLTWSLPAERVQEIEQTGLQKITVDVQVLTGRKR